VEMSNAPGAEGISKNPDGGLTGALGLDIVKRAGTAAISHYCSRTCKVAAERAAKLDILLTCIC
jgi:hypothetical protein